MTEYLSKEEIKKWRSSLEKITLEEYAARLGKSIEEEKQTNDLVDIVLHGQPVMSTEDKVTRGEKISSIAQRAFEREKELGHTPFAIHHNDKKVAKEEKVEKKETVKPIATPKINKTQAKVEAETQIQAPKTLREEVNYVFKKNLTDREQMVFDFFLKNQDQVVYAKDLAKLLNLPRDYVYKYIKNLRAKIEGDKLQNADNGGYVLTV
ncbi:helix-turn-helix domain-containing protein [bacterium]|nr:helix-turn-helix domain-containing protein [bacterium]